MASYGHQMDGLSVVNMPLLLHERNLPEQRLLLQTYTSAEYVMDVQRNALAMIVKIRKMHTILPAYTNIYR